MSSIFTIYIFAAWPLFAAILTYILLKKLKLDITLGLFMMILIVSGLPFLREVLLLMLMSNPFHEKILFKAK